MSALSDHIAQQGARYLMPNYRRFPLVITRGAGSWVWDADGKKYLDLFPGWGVAGLGHCHPAVAAAIARQAQKLLHCANNYYTEEQIEFAELLSTRADGQQIFFCNSGAEAAEGAIKLARLSSDGRYGVISFYGAFHGRTFAAISATGQPAYRRGFEPTVPGFAHAEYNNLASVEALIDDRTCAIMVEPVQGESGVIAATPEFLRGLRKLCDEKNLRLIFDEVQTTPARLGTWFGYQHFGVKPDIMTSAKAIAGGMPLGIFMADASVAQFLKPGTHASTFGGNSIGCAAGVAAIKVIEQENLLANIQKLGKLLDERINALRQKTAKIKDYRRVGFMVAVELNVEGAPIAAKCAANGVLINCTHDTVLRMLPAFNTSADEFDFGLTVLEQSLELKG
ncbi:MAG: acetylornithine/succinylornithine family transaminase [Planctomycetota bacterium]|jgi:predicted acetylornithine/succinylornithine family transaminase|nr:acetylornithine/succinylornithine family transaminase [Planctomycetota bacterium]